MQKLMIVTLLPYLHFHTTLVLSNSGYNTKKLTPGSLCLPPPLVKKREEKHSCRAWGEFKKSIIRSAVRDLKIRYRTILRRRFQTASH